MFCRIKVLFIPLKFLDLRMAENSLETNLFVISLVNFRKTKRIKSKFPDKRHASEEEAKRMKSSSVVTPTKSVVHRSLCVGATRQLPKVFCTRGRHKVLKALTLRKVP